MIHDLLARSNFQSVVEATIFLLHQTIYSWRITSRKLVSVSNEALRAETMQLSKEYAPDKLLSKQPQHEI